MKRLNSKLISLTLILSLTLNGCGLLSTAVDALLSNTETADTGSASVVQKDAGTYPYCVKENK